jgi:hypothetical protein
MGPPSPTRKIQIGLAIQGCQGRSYASHRKGDENAQAQDEERREEALQAHHRGTDVISDADAKVIKKWAPYGLN